MELLIFVGLIVLGYFMTYLIGWRFGKTNNVFLVALPIIIGCIGWPTIGFNYTIICTMLVGSSKIPTWHLILLPILFVISIIVGFYCGYSNSIKNHNENDISYPKYGKHGIE